MRMLKVMKWPTQAKKANNTFKKCLFKYGVNVARRSLVSFLPYHTAQ